MSFLNKIRNKILKKPQPLSNGESFKYDFSDKKLNSDWIISDWDSPSVGGVFKPNMIDLNHGMLGLKMTQIQEKNKLISIGSEIQYAKLCGYGTYEWTMRASSSSSMPNNKGKAFSGSISGLFNYIENSTTEIDFEIEGCYPNVVQMTSWLTNSKKENSSYNVNFSLSNDFLRYKYIWEPNKILFFINDMPIGTHTKNVPSKPAYPMINHWGTVDPYWGGVPSIGVDRWVWVKSFSFKPM